MIQPMTIKGTLADAVRVAAILDHPSAQSRMPQAVAIATETDMSAQDAIALMEKLAEAEQTDAASPPQSRIPSIAERHAEVGDLFDLGVALLPPDHGQEAGASGWDRALAKIRDRIAIAGGGEPGAGR
jgi:hypothetical protein